jgi:hypothetical protein
MPARDRSVTDGDRSKTQSVTHQPSKVKQLMKPVTDVTDFRQESHARAHARAHAKVTENSVTICHLSPDADAKRYATCDHDDPNKPVYRPSDDPLEFKRSVRFAAIDVMILTFAARRHAEWLNRIGVCPPDIAALIRKDTAYITNMLPPAEAAEPLEKPSSPSGGTVVVTPVADTLADVGPRSPGATRRTTPTPSLFDATRGDVGHTGRSGQAEAITGQA